MKRRHEPDSSSVNKRVNREKPNFEEEKGNGVVKRRRDGDSSGNGKILIKSRSLPELPTSIDPKKRAILLRMRAAQRRRMKMRYAVRVEESSPRIARNARPFMLCIERSRVRRRLAAESYPRAKLCARSRKWL